MYFEKSSVSTSSGDFGLLGVIYQGGTVRESVARLGRSVETILKPMCLHTGLSGHQEGLFGSICPISNRKVILLVPISRPGDEFINFCVLFGSFRN